jgi:hypothetical protein
VITGLAYLEWVSRDFSLSQPTTTIFKYGLANTVNFHTGRLLKYLAAISAIKQVSGNEFSANQITKNLTNKAAEPGILH